MIPYFSWVTIPLGPLTVYVWGLLVACGFLAGLWFVQRHAKEVGLDERSVQSLFLGTFVSSLLGARLAYIALFWETYATDVWRVLAIWDGGLVFLGGFLAAVAWIVWWLRRHRARIKQVWEVIDLFSPALALGLAIGRVGCFFIHDHPGCPMPWHAPWGVIMPDESIRHPVALYLVLLNAGLFVLLWRVRHRVLKTANAALAGLVSGLFFLVYGAGRFLLDFTRAYDTVVGIPPDPRFAGLTSSQYISIVFVCFGSVLLVWVWRRSRSSA